MKKDTIPLRLINRRAVRSEAIRSSHWFDFCGIFFWNLNIKRRRCCRRSLIEVGGNEKCVCAGSHVVFFFCLEIERSVQVGSGRAHSNGRIRRSDGNRVCVWAWPEGLTEIGNPSEVSSLRGRFYTNNYWQRPEDELRSNACFCINKFNVKKSQVLWRRRWSKLVVKKSFVCSKKSLDSPGQLLFGPSDSALK